MRLNYWAKYFGIPVPVNIDRTNYFVVKDTVLAAMRTFANKRMVLVAKEEIEEEARAYVQKNL